MMTLLPLWSKLCFVLALLPKGMLTNDDVVEIGDEDFRRPFWNIAHMVNALYQVDLYLDLGANSLEFDVAFDTDGTAQFTYHGYPCDCFRRCTRYEDFSTYVDYLRHLTTPGDPLFREELVLLFMDLKVKGLSPRKLFQAGEDVASKFLEHYWKEGTSDARAYILISLPSINHLGFIRGFRSTLQNKNATKYDPKIGFDFSGNEDLDLIRSTLESADIGDRIWIGDGITNCLPRSTSRLLDALDIRDQPRKTYIHKVYWWTVDRVSTMIRTLNLGVDGLITNHPERLTELLSDGPVSSQVRLATYQDNPWKKHPRRTANIMDASLQARGRNFKNEPLESIELLYNS